MEVTRFWSHFAGSALALVAPEPTASAAQRTRIRARVPDPMALTSCVAIQRKADSVHTGIPPPRGSSHPLRCARVMQQKGGSRSLPRRVGIPSPGMCGGALPEQRMEVWALLRAPASRFGDTRHAALAARFDRIAVWASAPAVERADHVVDLFRRFPRGQV